MLIEWDSLGYKPLIFLGAVAVLGLLVLCFGLIHARREYARSLSKLEKKKISMRRRSSLASMQMNGSAYNLFQGPPASMGSMYGQMMSPDMMPMQYCQDSMCYNAGDMNTAGSMMMGDDCMMNNDRMYSGINPQMSMYNAQSQYGQDGGQHHFN